MARRILVRWCAQIRLQFQLRWRAMGEADVPALGELVRRLSREDRRRRFHGAVNELTADALGGIGFVAVHRGPLGEQVLADARLAVDADGRGAELALMVDAGWRGRGLGAWCLRRLCREARARGIHRLRAAVLGDNQPMLRLLLQQGFQPRLEGGGAACWLDLQV